MLENLLKGLQNLHIDHKQFYVPSPYTPVIHYGAFINYKYSLLRGRGESDQ